MKRFLVTTRVSLFPPEHGGAKNIRHLVTTLTAAGVECRVIGKLQNFSEPKQRFAGQHWEDLKAASAQFDLWDEKALTWTDRGAHYEGVIGDRDHLALRSKECLRDFDPDVFLLCDDALDDGRALFQLAAESQRFAFLAGTIHCLPFGPFSMTPSETIAGYIRKARTIIAPSVFVKNYIQRHLGRTAKVYTPSVFGKAPFPWLGRYSNPYITIINPCPWKGSSIFLSLVKARPDLQFAAVPTWGTTPPLIEELRALPNVTLLAETPNIDRIFAQTRILLAPSLCQEAFGFVSPEALLRGVPVVASDIAGLRESTLGEAALIAVKPLSFDHPPQGEDPSLFEWNEPENDIKPWSDALDRILASESTYREKAQRGKTAAENFVKALEERPILPLFE
jgi:hypothetical protein